MALKATCLSTFPQLMCVQNFIISLAMSLNMHEWNILAHYLHLFFWLLCGIDKPNVLNICTHPGLLFVWQTSQAVKITYLNKHYK